MSMRHDQYKCNFMVALVAVMTDPLNRPADNHAVRMGLTAFACACAES
jgi:hypothetical protein